MWNELNGTVKRWAAVSGTLTLPAGARVIQIIFVGGTCTFPTGDGTTTQTMPGGTGPTVIQENHVNFIMGVLGGTGAQLQIVFGSTTSAYVEYINPPGLS